MISPQLQIFGSVTPIRLIFQSRPRVSLRMSQAASGQTMNDLSDRHDAPDNSMETITGPDAGSTSLQSAPTSTDISIKIEKGNIVTATDKVSQMTTTSTEQREHAC